MWMRTMRAAVVALAGAATVASAQDYRPAFRPETLTDRPAGAPNDVLVLGSEHLSTLPATFRPEMVAPLIDRLARWRPTAVASEDISGLHCDAMRHQRAFHAEAVDGYCYDPAAAGRGIGLDVVAANATVERQLGDWPATPLPAQRRRLAMLFLAAGEPASALVQWLRLASAERRAGDGLDDAAAAELRKRATDRNETALVAAPLAARAGLERVWSVDDQSFVGAPMDDAAYSAAIAKAWDNPANKAVQAADATRHARIAAPHGLLDLYRALNAPDHAAQAYPADWGAALTEPSAQGYGRRYVAYWETRNLRMVANIRELLGRAPGTRLVAIVGASHKGYYEAYLHQMRDVALADTGAVLR